MSYTIDITIWCDVCNDWDQYPTNKKRIANKMAIADGWKVARDKETKMTTHICERCREDN